MEKKGSAFLKCIAIIAVIFSHYSQIYICDSILSQFGAIGCCIFFFVSGYGLSYRLMRENSYFLYKILNIYGIFMLSNVLFILFDALSGTEYSYSRFILAVIGLKHVFICDWFIFVLLYFYVALLVSKSIKYLNPVVICFFIGCLYTYYTKHFNSISWILFPIGLLFNQFRFKENKYLTFASIAMFISALVIQSGNDGLCDSILRKLICILKFLSVAQISYVCGKTISEKYQSIKERNSTITYNKQIMSVLSPPPIRV